MLVSRLRVHRLVRQAVSSLSRGIDQHAKNQFQKLSLHGFYDGRHTNKHILIAQ